MHKINMSIKEDLMRYGSLVWENRKNPRFVWPAVTGALMASYSTGLLHTVLYWLFFTTVIIFSILSGLAVVLCRGNYREPLAPRDTPEQQRARRFLEQRTRNFNKHYFKKHTVISKDVDKAIQDVIDLCIRDFCLSWYRDVGKDETAFVEILNKEIWTLIENLLDRLRKVDNLNFLCNELVCVLYNHFRDLRLSDARKYPGQTTPFLLHPCLKTKDTEIKHIRVCSEALILSLLPHNVSKCAMARYLLREIVTGSLILPTVHSICDPDYINQTLVIYLEDREKITATQKQKYAYAETYEEFIKMINTSSDIDELKRLRYHVIAEIMQATVIHNSKGQTEEDGPQKNSKQNKKDALRDRNLKRYINQCQVSKATCEKRIRSLGGPDYRYYGLGHGQPFQGRQKRHSKAQRRERLKSTKILAFADIMDHTLARSFLMVFLNRHNSGNLLSFWIATEKLRYMDSENVHESASKIFNEFITPSAPKVIKFDSVMVRAMEEYVYGNNELDCFYDAQKIVYDIMEKKFYQDFVLSHDYTEFVCQSELANEEYRAQSTRHDEPVNTINWSDGFGFKERRNAEALKAAVPSNIEERNDYAVRKLQTLDQNINAKKKALELILRAYSDSAESQEKEILEQDIDQLQTERRQLEFHIDRTDLWCEMLGHWKATIVNAQYHPESKNPLFVICVSCDESAETIRDRGATVEGWVVLRELEDFKNLHDKLKECTSWMSKDLPISSKKWYKRYGSESLDSLKTSLQEYLTIILRDDRLSQSDEIYAFLIPSPEHLRSHSLRVGSTQSEKKSALSLLSNIRGSLQNIQFPDILVNAVDADEVEPGVEENVQDRKDSIAEPLYTLIGEVFELKGMFKVLRRSLILFVQLTFGGTINRHVREFVSWLVSEEMVVYYVNSFKQSMWPKGKLAPYPPPRTDLEKLRTREQAKEQMVKSIPDVLQHLVGKRNSRLGIVKLFEVVQDFQTNKHLFYMMLELVILTVCPEVKSEEVLKGIEETLGENIHESLDLMSPTLIKHFDQFNKDEE